MPIAARRTLILSISHDKDVRAIVHQLAPHFERFVLTQYQENPRATPAQKLAEMVRSEGRQTPASSIIVCPTPTAAWQHVFQTAVPGELVCITGSFYLAAEMRPLLVASER
jgi:dihydrofolate synthase/folylpolyglutamate synthase